jgi:type II pantothenate kinase
MSNPSSAVGVDVGATLCKLVTQKETRETARYSSSDLASAEAWLKARSPSRIAATGGGASALGREWAGARVERIPEFTAWGRGAPLVAAEAGVELPQAYLLVSLGTGTSALAVRDGRAERVGGSALGGGTLLGLGRLLLAAESFHEIAELAARGDRRRVDLLVGDIYRSGDIELPADLNAASFGKLESTTPEDLAHALMGLIGENLGIICTGLARLAECETIVYCGSTLDENRALEQVLSFATLAFGGRPVYLPMGAFCGAFGAAACLEE